MCCESVVLFQIVVEVVGDLVHQMDPPSAEDIVLGARVREIVQLDVPLDAFLDEAQAVLPDDCVVDGPLADE